MSKAREIPSYKNYSAKELLQDYLVAFKSREASLLGRKEVLGGKAKFGIFGDGKEMPQMALSKVFREGDWRSGYYRDQTWMLASDTTTLEAFFAQLYADTNLEREPHSGGRQMNCHYATRYINEKGEWTKQSDKKNVSSDISSTGGQMARLLGLAYASKLYRETPALRGSKESENFTNGGKEVIFGSIGNASTSEGHFWEVMNAAGVLELPILMSIWDDGYGISVPGELQTIKNSISEALLGFEDKGDGRGGFLIYKVKGNNYEALLETYKEAESKCRELSKPCLVHVTHITQPQGHSTSGSHERYKSKDRLDYESSIDCLTNFREDLIHNKFVDENTLLEEEKKIRDEVFATRTKAFENIQADRKKEQKEASKVLNELAKEDDFFATIASTLESNPNLSRAFIHKTLRQSLYKLRQEEKEAPRELINFLENYKEENTKTYRSHLLHSEEHPKETPVIAPLYSENSASKDARLIMRDYFDKVLARDPRFFVLGEDVGKLGGVNLEFEDLQEKYGELRVTDTGIREASILGQGLGAAMRGLKPLVDIQYLDYLIYCLQGMTDDLATLHYRTRGGQSAPCIVRTKGHRLEGIWHTGSPMGMLLGSLRGMHICVPRNAVQACGLYETLLKTEDPSLLIEVLNGYRLKEKCPDNLGSYSVPLGVPEILREGGDITIVTYGACVRIAEEACKKLEELSVHAELIDVQTLLPFDKPQTIAQSLSKTGAIIFMDEDVPGGATSFMMREVLERDGGYDSLDAKPRTLTASPTRSAYASDGDYYCKPSAEDLIDLALEIIDERRPF